MPDAEFGPCLPGGQSGQLIPGADLISTFSFDCVPSDGLGTNQLRNGSVCRLYDVGLSWHYSAGMTTCQCPTFNGPYQVGQTGQEVQPGGGPGLVCRLRCPPTTTGSSKIILDAENIAGSENGGTFPNPPGCVPDAPGGVACPLYVPGQTLPPDSGVDCAKVCSEYDS